MSSFSFNWENLWAEVFSLPPVEACEKFAEILDKAKQERMTLVNKTFKHLSENESSWKRDSCTTIIVKTILKLTIHSYQIDADGLIDLMNCLITEARHFSTDVLTKIVSSCLEFMENNSDLDLPIRWVDIFGKMVAVLTTRDEIDFNDDIINGKEFKSQVINSICRVPWGANNGASVISALREIPGIDSTEIALILSNAASSFQNLEPMSVPPIAHQLLLLAGDTRASSLIYHFDKYFGSVDFGGLSQVQTTTTGGNNSQSVTMNPTKRKALGSTVYFFIQYARHSETLTKEVIKRVKASAYDHNLVVTPFTLSVALGLTSLDHVKSVIVDALRNTIVKSFVDIGLGSECAWYHRVRGEVCDTISDCFTSVMDTKSSELDFMLDGMKELGIRLLDVDQLQERDPFAAEKCKSLGIYMITSIVQKNRDYLPGIINELLKHQKLPFIECLASCLKSVVRTIVQSSYANRMLELIQHLPMMTVDTASLLIKALLPALQLSNTLMNEMLMVLRKTIWKSVEARRISLSAMVLMLANSKIIGSIPTSQYSENSQTFYTQASQTQIDVFGGSRRSNEPLCFEIISILKRFFTQQLEVKDHLYIELHSVVRKNPELIGIICSQLVSHLKSYTNAKGELSLGKILDYSNIRELKLKESLGLLIQCLCFVTLRGQRVFRNDVSARPPSLTTSEEFLELVKNQLLAHGAEYYESEATKNSNDSIQVLSSQSQSQTSGSSQPPLDFWDVRNARNTLMYEVLGALEAYIEFFALGGEIGQTSTAQIHKLFQKYQQLKTTAEKAAGKDKGGSKKKKGRLPPTLNSTALPVYSQSSQQSNGNSQTQNSTAATSNVTTATKSSKASGKLGPNSNKKKLVIHHVMNLESVKDILKDYYGVIDDEGPLLAVQGDISFEKYLLGVVTQKLGKQKRKEDLKERKRKVLELVETLAGISSTMWEACHTPTTILTSRGRGSTDSNESTTMTSRTTRQGQSQSNNTTTAFELNNAELRLHRLEIITAIAEFLHTKYPNHRTLSLGSFNSSGLERTTYEEMFADFFTTWKKVFKMCVDCTSDNLATEIKYLFAILDIFCKSLKPECVQSVEVKQWFDKFIFKNPRNLEPTEALVECFLKPYITCGMKSCRIPKHFITLARQAHFVLEDLDNETERFAPEDGQKSWLVDVTTSVHIIISLGNYAGNCIKLINEVLGKLKAHSAFIDLEKLGSWRDDSCLMLEFLLKLCTEFVRSQFTSGPCGELLLKLMSQFFATMTTLTEDLIAVHNSNKVDFSSKRFEYLVKLIGKDFKVRVEALINHVESLGKEEACTKNKNKNGTMRHSLKQKFMKDARNIPDLVYKMEKYEKQVIALSKKTKVNLLVGSKLSTARDFRIQLPEIQQAQAQNPDTSALPPRPNTSTTSRSKSRPGRGSTQADASSRAKSSSRPPSASKEAGPSRPVVTTQTARRSRGHAHGNATSSRSRTPAAREMDEVIIPGSSSEDESETPVRAHAQTFPSRARPRRSPSPEVIKCTQAQASRVIGTDGVRPPLSRSRPRNASDVLSNSPPLEEERSYVIEREIERGVKRMGSPVPSTSTSKATKAPVPVVPEKRTKFGVRPMKTSTPRELPMILTGSSQRILTSGANVTTTTIPSPIHAEIEEDYNEIFGRDFLSSSPERLPVPASIPESGTDYSSGTRTVTPSTPTGPTGNTAPPRPATMRHLGLKRKRPTQAN